MSAASPPIIVFDLDGTLVDTAPDLISALNHVLDREGLRPVPLSAARNMIGAGARKLLERGLEVEGRVVSIGELDRLTRDFIDFYAEHIADGSRPFDGLEAALDRLASKGHRLAVCTNKLEWLSKLLLDRLDLTPRFAAICGQDTFGIAKPDPAFLRETVEKKEKGEEKTKTIKKNKNKKKKKKEKIKKNKMKIQKEIRKRS